jgi:hypothetical protein
MTRDRLLEYQATDGVMVLIKVTKADSADFLRNQRLTPLAPTHERVIFRKSAGTVVDFVALGQGRTRYDPRRLGVMKETTSEE